MTARNWDFENCACGKAHKSMTFFGDEKIPETIECACGKSVGWSTMSSRAQIKLTNSGRKYGEFWPQYGQVVESYGHLKQLERETGLYETGPPERIDDILSETPPERTPSDPSILIAASTEELMEQIPRDQIDSVATGNSLNQPLQGGPFKL